MTTSYSNPPDGDIAAFSDELNADLDALAVELPPDIRDRLTESRSRGFTTVSVDGVFVGIALPTVEGDS